MNFFLLSLIKAAVVAFVLLTTLAYLQWVERKVIAHIQVRLGPSRVGPHGLLQPLADVIKLITKEDILPPYVNKFLYLAAPFFAIVMALLSISVIPFGAEIHIFGGPTWMQLTDVNIGVLFVLAVSSVGVYGIALAGWASNNKYSLMGGLRSSAQMISYELPLSMAIAAPLLLANTLSLRQLVERQAGYYLGFIPRWSIFQGPMPQIFSFIIFLIAAFAETNRIPFDLPEAENELVAGYHTEYSSMKFAAFFMAEYSNMITVCAMTTTLFLGGWLPLWPASGGSNLRAGGGLRVCRRRGAVPWAQSRAPPGSRDTAGSGGRLLSDSRDFSGAGRARRSAAAFLVRGQDRHAAVRFHLGARHAAALPLRSTDGLRVEASLPRRRPQPAGHRPFGGRVFLTLPKMDVFLFLIFAAIAVVCGINVVVQSHPISSAFR